MVSPGKEVPFPLRWQFTVCTRCGSLQNHLTQQLGCLPGRSASAKAGLISPNNTAQSMSLKLGQEGLEPRFTWTCVLTYLLVVQVSEVCITSHFALPTMRNNCNGESRSPGRSAR